MAAAAATVEVSSCDEDQADLQLGEAPVVQVDEELLLEHVDRAVDLAAWAAALAGGLAMTNL